MGMILPPQPPAGPQLLHHHIKISPNACSHHLYWGWECSSTITHVNMNPQGVLVGPRSPPWCHQLAQTSCNEHLETPGPGKTAQGKSRSAIERCRGWGWRRC